MLCQADGCSQYAVHSLVAVKMQLLAKQLFADSLQLLFQGTIYLIKPCYRFVSVVVVVGASGLLTSCHEPTIILSDHMPSDSSPLPDDPYGSRRTSIPPLRTRHDNSSVLLERNK